MQKTCGELLVEILEAYDVDTVFGIPGVHTVELYRGLPNTNITHITPRHEQGAGFMADGYARVSGKPGVCFIITGPGMTNIMTAMAQAAGDCIPMLVISSVNPIRMTGSQEGHLHELNNQQAMISQVASLSKTVWSAESLPSILAEAFTFLNSAKPGPVHIQLPLDIITADASQVSFKIGSIAQKPLVPKNLLDEAAALLNAAKSPMVLFGGGCIDVNPDDAVELIERLNAPATTTINAKGLLPASHPLHLGSNATFTPVRDLIQHADVVLAIGTELGQTDYDLYCDELFRINGKLIRIDIDARQTHRSFIADIAIVGDAPEAVLALKERITPKPQTTDLLPKLHHIRKQLITDYPRQWDGQNAILKHIRDTLANVIMVGDSTQIVYSGNHGFMANNTRHWFNSATGYGTLGYGLPAAIGASIATQSPIVCLIGDGGIQFTLSELICATELKLPVIILLWNNEGYGEIRSFMQEKNLPTIGVDILTPDFEWLAKGMGAAYNKINSKEALTEQLINAANLDYPSILEIREGSEFIEIMGKSHKYFS